MKLKKLTFERDTGELLELSLDEAERLYRELDALFGDRSSDAVPNLPRLPDLPPLPKDPPSWVDGGTGRRPPWPWLTTWGGADTETLSSDAATRGRFISTNRTSGVLNLRYAPNRVALPLDSSTDWKTAP